MYYGHVYSILFQLWIDEISIADYYEDVLDEDVYTRMSKAYSKVTGCIPIPDKMFSVLADDAFIILDVAAAVHCKGLGEFTDINEKRKEMSVLAYRGIPFCKEPRRIELISEDLDLSFILTMFNSFEYVSMDLSELSRLPIVGFTNTSVLH